MIKMKDCIPIGDTITTVEQLSNVNVYIGLRLTLSDRDVWSKTKSSNQASGVDTLAQNLESIILTRINSSAHLYGKEEAVYSGKRNHVNTTNVLRLSPDVNRSILVGWKDHPVSEDYLDTFALGIQDKPPPRFLESLKSHCFVIGGSQTSNRNIKKHRPIKGQSQIGDQPTYNGIPSVHAKSLHCLPPFYFIGVSKCGTTEFYGHFIQHQHVIAPVFKEPRFWDESRPTSIQKRSMEYMTRNHETLAAIIENCYIGNDSNKCHGIFQSQRWDFNIRLNLNDLFQELQEYRRQGQPCPLVSVDSSTTYVSNSYKWENDPRNTGFHQPNALVPHRIHHVQPNAKFVILLRDPVERLYSDFYFFIKGNGKTSELFHKLVVNGIAWWNQCTQQYSDETCAYASKLPNISSLPDGIFSWGETSAGKFNGAGRLRQGLYSVYISKWYDVFPKAQILIINFEEYSSNSTDILKSKVYPYLEMAQLNAKGEAKIKELKKKGHLNKAKRKPQKMLAETQKLLKKFYRPYNEKLADLLGDKKYLWQDNMI